MTSGIQLLVADNLSNRIFIAPNNVSAHCRFSSQCALLVPLTLQCVIIIELKVHYERTDKRILPE